MKHWFSKRGLPLLLCLAVIFNTHVSAYGLGSAGGAETDGDILAESLCAHHRQHDADCGYTKGRDCRHRHTEDCYKEIQNCVHIHTEDCDSEEDSNATSSNAAERKPKSCSHSCSEESGCITKILSCSHEHNEDCGFVEGKGCSYVCAVCSVGKLAGTRSKSNASKLSDYVTFTNIYLTYTDAEGRPGKNPIKENTLLEKDDRLALCYEYEISEEQCKKIQEDTDMDTTLYYLDVSPHLELPDLTEGSPLTIDTGEEGGDPVTFGWIFSDGEEAWVEFKINDSGAPVLSEYGELYDAYFYLNCQRAKAVPEDEAPADGENRYIMECETIQILTFGYAENEPVIKEAELKKTGKLDKKTITWEIDYIPRQNPSGNDGITLDTPMEIRDTIDGASHSFIEESIKIDGEKIPVYASGNTASPSDAAYAVVETSEDGSRTVLSFGGTRFCAGKATQGNSAKPLKITYETSINDELLLPGTKSGGKTITNTAGLFARKNLTFESMNISSTASVMVPTLQWIKKEGKTTRTPGQGSVTDWTVTFYPNGFTFKEENTLTLHDILPSGSTLIEDSVKVAEGGTLAAGGVLPDVTPGENNSFSVSPISASNTPVSITYQTHVAESAYEDGTDLGKNTAWFTFSYNGIDYKTPEAIKSVPSETGNSGSETSVLLKAADGTYDPKTRTIGWKVTINPHKTDLRSGTFTDNLSQAGGGCHSTGHNSGLELIGDEADITVLIDGNVPETADAGTVQCLYDRTNRVITVKTENLGRRTVTLSYQTKVCDPCIFANNTNGITFKNVISTEDMIIGSSVTPRSASAAGTEKVSAKVLLKEAPVYDYKTGTMLWTIKVNTSGLPMEHVILTDILPKGLAYKKDSLTASSGSLAPVASCSNASPDNQRQTLTISLGNLSEETTVQFCTEVNPELLGFAGKEPVIEVTNTVSMNGMADGLEFKEVSSTITKNFTNHGLMKESGVDNQLELIQYDVLINPFGISLPETPKLVDTMDKRLQLDTDSLKFCKVELSGTSNSNNNQKPGYKKNGDSISLKIADFDPTENKFTVELPIEEGSRDAYVLSYAADIIKKESGGYSNSVSFEGSSVLLGGGKDNNATVGGGGGGGGGGVAARKATISVTKRDKKNQEALQGVSFTLFQWDEKNQVRGLPFAQGITDASGTFSFKVKPGGKYELVETESISGYSSVLEYDENALPDNVTPTKTGLLITAGAAKSVTSLELKNQPLEAEIAFRLFNQFHIPMAGAVVQVFKTDPSGVENPVPDEELTVSTDGTLKLSLIRRGSACFIRLPGGEIMAINVPADADVPPTLQLPDGSEVPLTEDFELEGSLPEEQQRTLTVTKVISGSTVPLEGAVFWLYGDEECMIPVTSGVSGPDGAIVFQGLMRGQCYWLREQKAPDHYDLDRTVYPIGYSDSNITIQTRALEMEVVLRLFNQYGIPMGGTSVPLFLTDPSGTESPVPDEEFTVSPDGTLKLSRIRRGFTYFIRTPGGGIMTIHVPADADKLPMLQLPDGSEVLLTDDFRLEDSLTEDWQWALTVTKVISGSTTPLKGAVFGLYVDEDCTVPIASGISGPDGTFVFQGLMRGQCYWLKEQKAPDRYNLDLSVYPVDMSNTGITISNSPETPDVKPDDPDHSGNSGGGGSEGGGNSGNSGGGGPEGSGNSGSSGGGGSEGSGNSGSSGGGSPEGSGGSGNPGGSEGGDSGEPDNPGGSIDSGNSGSSGDSGNSGGNGDSGNSGGNKDPGTSGGPGSSDNSGDTGQSDFSRRSNASEKPENLYPGSTVDSPGISRNTEITDTSGNAKDSDARSSRDADGIPGTGDRRPWFFAAAFLSGIMLLMMSLYGLLHFKKKSSEEL